jgi:hypothetical protein
MNVTTGGLTWHRLEPRDTDNGHAWEGGYRDRILVTVRCANCTRPPIEVLREDFTSEPCGSAPVGKAKARR